MRIFDAQINKDGHIVHSVLKEVSLAKLMIIEKILLFFPVILWLRVIDCPVFVKLHLFARFLDIKCSARPKLLKLRIIEIRIIYPVHSEINLLVPNRRQTLGTYRATGAALSTLNSDCGAHIGHRVKR